jgi:hypothetical protein
MPPINTDMIALNKIAAIGLRSLGAAPPLLNDPLDVSGDFRALENFCYLADRLGDFDPAAGTGKMVYQRAQYHVRHALDNDLALITAVGPNEFPEDQYAANPELPFSTDSVSPRTIRIRMTSGAQLHPPQPELMLAGEVPHDNSRKYEKIPGGRRYAGAFGSVTIRKKPLSYRTPRIERLIADGQCASVAAQPCRVCAGNLSQNCERVGQIKCAGHSLHGETACGIRNCYEPKN